MAWNSVAPVFFVFMVCLVGQTMAADPLPSPPPQGLEQPSYPLTKKVLQVIEVGKGALIEDGNGAVLLLSVPDTLADGDKWTGWAYEASGIYRYTDTRGWQKTVHVYVATSEPPVKDVSPQGIVTRGFLAGSQHALFYTAKPSAFDAMNQIDPEKFGTVLRDYVASAKAKGGLEDVALTKNVSFLFGIWNDAFKATLVSYQRDGLSNPLKQPNPEVDTAHYEALSKMANGFDRIKELVGEASPEIAAAVCPPMSSVAHVETPDELAAMRGKGAAALQRAGAYAR